MRFLKWLREAEWIASGIELLTSQWGRIVLTFSTFGGVVMSVWGWFSENFSHWQLAMIFICVTAIFLWMANLLLAVCTKLTFDTSKYRELGDRIESFSDRMLRDMREWLRDHPEPDFFASRDNNDRSFLDDNTRWKKEKSAFFAEKFQGDCLYYSHLLKRLGIHAPEDLQESMWIFPERYAVWLNQIGKLLSSGYLEEAKSGISDKGIGYY